jgi:hypothetical protein
VNDIITTVPTHGVVINSVNDAFQATYISSSAASNPGVLDITAHLLALPAVLPTTAGVYEGATLATALLISGSAAVAGASGIVVLENGNTTSIYYATDVTHIATSSTLEAVLVGVTPLAANIQLVA